MFRTKSVAARANEFVVKGFGVGWLPVAPGTFGSAIGALLIWGVSPYLTQMTYILFAALLGALAWACIHFYELETAEHDSSPVVIDEISGISLCFIGLPIHPQMIVAGFVLFRLFDILKPFPISWADEKVGGSWGTLLDDLMAGAIGCACLHLGVYWNLL